MIEPADADAADFSLRPIDEVPEITPVATLTRDLEFPELRDVAHHAPRAIRSPTVASRRSRFLRRATACSRTGSRTASLSKRRPPPTTSPLPSGPAELVPLPAVPVSAPVQQVAVATPLTPVLAPVEEFVGPAPDDDETSSSFFDDVLDELFFFFFLPPLTDNPHGGNPHGGPPAVGNPHGTPPGPRGRAGRPDRRDARWAAAGVQARAPHTPTTPWTPPAPRGQSQAPRFHAPATGVVSPAPSIAEPTENIFAPTEPEDEDHVTLPPAAAAPLSSPQSSHAPVASLPPARPARGRAPFPLPPRLRRASSQAAPASAITPRLPLPPRGEVAQLVEHTTENRGVAGSIPALAIPPGPRHQRQP